MANLSNKQEIAVKALTLDFYLTAIKLMIEAFGKDGLYKKIIDKSDASVTTLIDSLMRHAKISSWVIDEDAQIDYMLGYVTKKQSEYREELNYYFVESALPFLNWRDVIASVRGRMVEGQNFEGKEESMFCAMLAYQNIWIEKFVLKNV